MRRVNRLALGAILMLGFATGAAALRVTVTATHEPSGTIYLAVTQADGRYSIPNLLVGA